MNPTASDPQADAALVSVIVATRNSARTIERCLASIRQQTYPCLELIVVDNHSSDGTDTLARIYADVVATRGPERSAQRNHGAQLAQGEFLVFIDSDMILDVDVVAQGIACVQDSGQPAAVIPERSFGEGFWTQCRVLERDCYRDDDTVEAARIFRRRAFEAVGGYDVALDAAEDWDLSRRVAGAVRLPRTASIIHHDEGRTTVRGAFLKRRRYAPGYLRYLRKHGRGAVGQGNPVVRMAFVRHWRDLGRHPLRATGMVVLKSVELIAVVQVLVEQWLRPGRTGRARAVVVPGPSSSPLLVTFGSVSRPDGGVQVRSRLIAETLTDLGCPPVVLSTREPEGTTAPPWARRLRVPRRKPFKAFSPGFARLIHEESAGASVLIITNAMFLPVVALSRSRLPMIWDTNECQTLHYRRLPPTAANRVKYLAWMVLERWAARRCQVAIAISDTEAGTWHAFNRRLEDKVAVIDHAAFWAAPATDPRAELQRRLGRSVDGPVLVFLGTMRAKHNLAAAHWILEHLVTAVPPGATVVLCGPGSEDLDLTASAARTIVALGAVDDVDTVLAAADVCLAPLATGAGVKTKVLHYLAHAKRVAGTPAAFEGLTGAPGLFSAGLEDLASLIADLCQTVEDPESAAARERAQRAWLEEHHGRAHVRSQWQGVLHCLETP